MKDDAAYQSLPANNPANPHFLMFRKLNSMPTWLPNPWVRRGRIADDDYSDTYDNVISYDLAWYQRLFVTMEYPNSCRAARLYQYINILVISGSVLTAYLSSMSQNQYQPTACLDPACDNDPLMCKGVIVCRPIPFEGFQIIDFICCILYAIDLFTRISIAPVMSARILRCIPKHWDEMEQEKPPEERREEPDWGPLQRTLRYTSQIGNIIDIMATLPYFIIILSSPASVENSFGAAPWILAHGDSTILTVRVARCFRLLKILDVHPQGSPKLSLIIRTVRTSFSSLLILLGFVVISGVIFGSLIYTSESGDFRITEEYPLGEYMRYSLNENQWEVSPFSNLGRCMYWAIVTMTTLGYGDLYPTSTWGRTIGAACAMYGVLIISLPVTIINNAFSTEMNAYAVSVAAEKIKLRQKAKLDAVSRKLAKQEAAAFQKIDQHTSMSDPDNCSSQRLVVHDASGTSPSAVLDSPSEVRDSEPAELPPNMESIAVALALSVQSTHSGAEGDGSDEVTSIRAHDLPFHQAIKTSNVHTSATRRSSFMENLTADTSLSVKSGAPSPTGSPTGSPVPARAPAAGDAFTEQSEQARASAVANAAANSECPKEIIQQARKAGVISKKSEKQLLEQHSNLQGAESRRKEGDFTLKHVVNAAEPLDNGFELHDVGAPAATTTVTGTTAGVSAAGAAPKNRSSKKKEKEKEVAGAISTKSLDSKMDTAAAEKKKTPVSSLNENENSTYDESIALVKNSSDDSESDGDSDSSGLNSSGSDEEEEADNATGGRDSNSEGRDGWGRESLGGGLSGRESIYNPNEVKEIMGKIRAARVALDDLEVSLYKHF